MQHLELYSCRDMRGYSGVKWEHPNRENERAIWEGWEGRKGNGEMM